MNSPTIENKLQNDWLKKHKPNSYHETVTNKKTDKLIGITIEFTVKGEKVTETILKRRKFKREVKENYNTKFIDDYHYFTQTKVLTLESIEKLRINND